MLIMHNLDYPNSRLSEHFCPVPASSDNRGCTVHQDRTNCFKSMADALLLELPKDLSHSVLLVQEKGASSWLHVHDTMSVWFLLPMCNTPSPPTTPLTPSTPHSIHPSLCPPLTRSTPSTHPLPLPVAHLPLLTPFTNSQYSPTLSSATSCMYALSLTSTPLPHPTHSTPTLQLPATFLPPLTPPAP